MGFVFEIKTSEYDPNTVIQEDIRVLISNEVRVIAAYRKSVYAEKYEEITYLAKKVDWSVVKYPEEFRYLQKMLHH